MDRAQTLNEERFNVITHAIGVIGAIVGTPFLFGEAIQLNTAIVVGLIAFGFGMVFLYLASTLYHLEKNGSRKSQLRVYDHIGIYLLIAGTYTPVALLRLMDSHGVLILSLVWGITIIGLILKIFYTGQFNLLSSLLYLVMGWTVAIEFGNLTSLIGASAFNWMLAGGLFYTVGIIFYLKDSIKYFHGIWHLFVLAGSICHFMMVWDLIQ